MPAKTASWQFVAFDPVTWTTAGHLHTPKDVVYTRELDAGCQLEGTIVDPEDLKALGVKPYTRAIKAYRNGVLRFFGQVVPPFVRSGSEGIKFIARDPWHYAAWRRVRAALTLTDDLTDIAWHLLNLQNGYRTMYLRAGALAATGARTREFAAGHVVAEQVEYLTRLTDSFHFRLDAVDAVANVMADFETWTSPIDKSSTVRFEFGPDNMSNCHDYTEEWGNLRNRVAIVGTKAGVPIVVSSEDAASIAAHGLWEDERGHVLTSDTTQLANIAEDYKIVNPPVTTTMKPSAEAPQLFTDFDVGNIVRRRIRDQGYNTTGTGRVNKAVLRLDNNSGAELLDEVVLETEPT